MSGRLISALALLLSPERRRWRQFLGALSLDPEGLARPLDAPGAADFIVCGPPRSGTSLMSAVLFQPPSVVTVMEPWDGMRLPPAELFRSLRAELHSTRRLCRGRLDVPALHRSGAVSWWPEGSATPELDVAETTLLGVKWPAYTRYLDLLPTTKFVVCLRDPFEVISSFKSTGGALARGLEYDTVFNRALNRELRAATTDVTRRRVLLYDAVNRQILPHLGKANVFAARYERWFTDRDRLLADLEGFLGTDLRHTAVHIRRPGAGSRLTPDEVALVQETCRTSEPLGYRLGGPGSTAAPG